MPFAEACRRLRVPFLTGICLLILALPAVSATPPVYAATRVPFVTVQTFARDVFIIEGSSLRNPDDTTALSAPLFNDAGVSLGLTWGAWAQATATGAAHIYGNTPTGHTNVHIKLHGLIPGGVYSVFYLTLNPDSQNALCPGVERALPLLSRDALQQPDRSSFVAGRSGQAEFKAQIAGHPLDALQVYYEIIYHLDGHTWGSLPNHGEALTQGPNCRSSFGEDAMRQALIYQKQ